MAGFLRFYPGMAPADFWGLTFAEHRVLKQVRDATLKAEGVR